MKLLNKHRNFIPKDAVYIGRGSKWGNPFIIGKDGTREEVISKYEKYIRSNPALLKCLPELVGHDLVCFCAPLPCHGNILIRLVGELR
mgnify:CR=1 FL=1